MRQKLSQRVIGEAGIFPPNTLNHAKIRFAHGHWWFHFAFKYDDISNGVTTFERHSGEIVQ